MRFAQVRHCWVVVVLLCAGTCAQTATKDAEVRVLVYDNARVSSAVLDQAGIEATRIFQKARIRLLWVNCSARKVGHECRDGPAENDLVLHVIPHGKTSNDFVFGEAYLSEDGTGRYADVFFQRIKNANWISGASEWQLLGAVAAHEIGHLLLGPRAHNWMGIMAARWSAEDLRQMEMGSLLFTRQQADRMKEHLHREHVSSILEASRSEH